MFTIKADNVDAAAEEIIGFLARQRQVDAICLTGWFDFGVGASAILKEVVKRLSVAATREETGIEKVIHIDCSLWQSKRSLQKAIAEELKLPREVMAFFDHSDEEDDFDGVWQAVRGVIPQVKSAILNELNKCKFLVVFHNGSDSYVDLWEYGVPVMGVTSQRVLWTSGGRFGLFHGMRNMVPDSKDLVRLNNGYIVIFPSSEVIMYAQNEDDAANDILWRFLLAEAEEVARYCGVPELNSKIVLECILYVVLRQDYGINWRTHAANYWICDGIILNANHCGRSEWEIGDALHRNMNLDWDQSTVQKIRKLLCDKQQWRYSDRWVFFEESDRWVSATGQETTAAQVPTSIFWTESVIEGGMFKHFNRSKLGVLHLSKCTFSFSSPPFLICSNLRFLLLDHCKDKNDAPYPSVEQDRIQVSDDGACFQKLWVLELSYTDWYWLLSKKMLDLMVQLRELNVKGPSNWIISHLHRWSGAGSDRHRPFKLRVVEGAKDNGNIGDSSGRRKQQASSFPDLSSWYNLKTIILDGCSELEEIGCNTLPPSLESLSFTSDLATKIKSMSFRGCAILKRLLLRGLFGELVELDMSGTSVKTLDLSETQALRLKRVFLLGCGKLRAILWPQKNEEDIKLEVLHIDTTRTVAWAMEGNSNKQEATSNSTVEIHRQWSSPTWSSSPFDVVHCLSSISTSAEPLLAALHGNDHTLANLDVYVSLWDARLFRSLLPIKIVKNLHIEISSISDHNGASQGIDNIRGQIAAGNLYADGIISTFTDNSRTVGANGDVINAPTIKWLWPCPLIPMDSNSTHCYISVKDETPAELLHGTTSTKQETNTTLPGFVHEQVKTLHLHDCLFITCMPGPTTAFTLDSPTASLHWNKLQWCQLERCPNLEGSVFTTPSIKDFRDNVFSNLETFWASHLLKARCIWDWSTSYFRPGYGCFENLAFLHLDCCPRLVHVLPLYTSNGNGCRSLETLEIVCCGELREVFSSDSQSQQQQQHPREFPSLKRIHLYELPMLQHMYRRRMFAPKLETVKIRGCWSLKRLPAVWHGPRSRIFHRLPTVDCEKDWWNNLEWDGKEAGHHPSHYRTTHSAYCKKTLLRTTVLR
ncbi:unnamed protein product [Urochloa humidicola]